MKNVNCYEWYQTLDEEDLILSFQGDFSHELVKAILILTENGDHNTGRISSRVFGVIVECLQNIYKHGAEKPEGSKLRPGIILIGKTGTHYFIHSGNMVLNSEKDNLSSRLDELNTMDEEALRKNQQEILRTTTLTEEGNAGIGLIYMKRKCEGKINYQFKPYNDRISFFSLYVKIPNE